MILRYNKQLRDETSANVITTLMRKGWLEVEIPKHDTKTEQLKWIDGVPLVISVVGEPDPELSKELAYVIRFFAAKLNMPELEITDLIKTARRRARG